MSVASVQLRTTVWNTIVLTIVMIARIMMASSISIMVNPRLTSSSSTA